MGLFSFSRRRDEEDEKEFGLFSFSRRRVRPIPGGLSLEETSRLGLPPAGERPGWGRVASDVFNRTVAGLGEILPMVADVATTPYQRPEREGHTLYPLPPPREPEGSRPIHELHQQLTETREEAQSRLMGTLSQMGLGTGDVAVADVATDFIPDVLAGVGGLAKKGASAVRSLARPAIKAAAEPMADTAHKLILNQIDQLIEIKKTAAAPDQVLRDLESLKTRIASGEVGAKQGAQLLESLGRRVQETTDPHLGAVARATEEMKATPRPPRAEEFRRVLAAIETSPTQTAVEVARPKGLAVLPRETAPSILGDPSILPEGPFKPPLTAAQFNYGKLDLPTPEMRAGVAEIMNRNLEEFAQRGFGAQGKGWDRLTSGEELAKKLGMTTEDFLATKGAKIFNEEEMALLNATTSGAARKTSEIGQRLKLDPDNLSLQLQLDRAYYEYKTLLSLSAGSASEGARMLNAQKVATSYLDAASGARIKLMRKYKRSMGPEAMEVLVRIDPQDTDRLFDFLAVADRPDFGKHLYTYWISNVLYGAGTQARNFLGNGTMLMVEQLAMPPIEAAIDIPFHKLGGRQREFYFNEFPTAAAWQTGMTRGVQKGLKILLEGFSEAEAGKLTLAKNPFYVSSRRAELLGKPVKAKLLKGAGHVVDPPFRALSAVDILARSIAETTQAHRLSIRSAMKAGLKPGSPEFANHVEGVLRERPAWFVEDVAERGKKVTLTDAPSELTRKFMGLRNMQSGLGRYVVSPLVKVSAPFARVADRIAARGFEVTPVGFIEAGYKASKHGLTPEITELTARAATGSLVFMGALGMAANGRITAGAPRNQAQRDQFYNVDKKQPWSVKIGDTWYPFSQLEPVSFPLGIAAVLYHSFTDENYELPSEKAEAIAMGMGQFMGDKTYLQGVSNMFDLVQGDIPPKYIARLAATVAVPGYGLMKNIAELVDNSVIRDPETIVEHILNVIPGARSSVPAKLDVRGREVSKSAGARSIMGGTPIAFSEEEMGDLIDIEFRNLGVVRGFPGKQRAGSKLTREQWRQLHQASSQIADAQIAKEMKNEEYWSRPPAERAKILKRIINNSRDYVAYKMGLTPAAIIGE